MNRFKNQNFYFTLLRPAHYIMTLVLIIHWPADPLKAQSPEMLFDKANLLYQEQSYEKAIEFYKQILARGYESNEIYYNLGNCYYRLDMVGHSILFYEKARQLDPDDPDIEYNLELAELKVIDRIELPPRFFLFEWWDKFRNYFSIYQLTRLLVIFYIFSIVSLIIFLYLKKDRLRRYILILTVILGMITSFSGYLLYSKAQSYLNHRYGIVLDTSVTVYSAPAENSTDVFIIHEGLKVRMDELREEWVKISLPDGKSGWIKTETLGII